MTNIPTLSPKEIVKILHNLGFELYRQKGSHQIFVKGALQVVVPMHNKDLKKGTMFQIIKGAGLTVEEFLKHK